MRRTLARALLLSAVVLVAVSCTPTQMARLHRALNPDGPYRASLCATPDETGGRWDCAPEKVAQLRREAARATEFWADVVAARQAQAQASDLVWHWQEVANCESGDNIYAVNPSGTYRGWLQFDVGSWQANGGTGDPYGQPREVAARVAENYRLRSGTSPWPVCGAYYR